MRSQSFLDVNSLIFYSLIYEVLVCYICFFKQVHKTSNINDQRLL